MFRRVCCSCCCECVSSRIKVASRSCSCVYIYISMCVYARACVPGRWRATLSLSRVCVCACVRVRACVRECVRACVRAGGRACICYLMLLLTCFSYNCNLFKTLLCLFCFHEQFCLLTCYIDGTFIILCSLYNRVEQREKRSLYNSR